MSNKRMSDAYKQIDRNKAYPIAEAVKMVKQFASKNFDETVEVSVNLGIDPKKGEQMVRATVVLPHAFGKSKIVAAFVSEDRIKEAKDAGADIIYSESTLPELIKTGKIEFDVAIAIPDVMKLLAPLAKVLGPKGLMPSPKNETITTNIAKTIAELKKGKISYKNDVTANLHQPIAKVSLDTEKITENFNAFIDSVKKAKPESTKGIYMKSVTISSSMGPGVKVDVK